VQFEKPKPWQMDGNEVSEPIGAKDDLRIDEQVGEVETGLFELVVGMFDRIPEVVGGFDGLHFSLWQDRVHIHGGVKDGARRWEAQCKCGAAIQDEFGRFGQMAVERAEDEFGMAHSRGTSQMVGAGP
jgi:hypothetical protein